MDVAYDGPQVVGLDLHRRHTVMVRMTPAGERLEAARFASDPDVLAAQIAKAGDAPDVVLDATYGGTGRPTCWLPRVLDCTLRTRWG